MVPALGDFELLGGALAGHPVDQPVFQRDPTRPPALQIAAQRFGLAGPAEGTAQALLDQAVQSIERVGVARWQMRGLLLFVLAFANLNDIWSPDVLPNALFAWTVVREGNVDYDEFVLRPAERDRVAETTTNVAPDKLDSEAYVFRACVSRSSVTATTN